MVDIIINMESVPANPPETVSDHVFDFDPEADPPTTEDTVEEHRAMGNRAWLSPPFRAKTRLLSRSRSVSDLSEDGKLNAELELFRRNSSGEYNQQYLSTSPLSLLSNKSHPELSTPNLANKGSSVVSDKIPSPVSQLSPITNLQYPCHHAWRPTKCAPVHEDTFTILLQTTAERVLNKLKTRQQDLGRNSLTGRKVRRHPQGALHHQVPRKLQPILRDGGKTPHLQDASVIDKSDNETICAIPS